MDRETITYRRTITGVNGDQHHVEIVLDPHITEELRAGSQRFRDIRRAAEAMLKKRLKK